jgi:hypothetical protein
MSQSLHDPCDHMSGSLPLGYAMVCACGGKVELTHLVVQQHAEWDPYVRNAGSQMCCLGALIGTMAKVWYALWIRHLTSLHVACLLPTPAWKVVRFGRIKIKRGVA